MQPRTNPVGQNNCPLFQVGFVIYNSVASHKSNGWKRAAGLKSHGHFGFLVLNPPELRIPALDRVESASIKNDAVHSVTAQEAVQVVLLSSFVIKIRMPYFHSRLCMGRQNIQASVHDLKITVREAGTELQRERAELISPR